MRPDRAAPGASAELGERGRRCVRELVGVVAGSPVAAVMSALLLTGSHARGEATVGEDSDLDVYVITERRIGRRRLAAFFQHLARTAPGAAERFRVDLHVLSRSDLPSLPPVIRYFDLQRDAKVLVGVDVRDALAPMAPGDLPTYEGLRRMLNAVFFFLERDAARRADGPSRVAYLYAEAAHAFAIPVGTYRAGLEATLEALAGSPYGRLLAARIVDHAGKFRSAQVRPAACSADARDWRTALLDFAAMIDLYAECAYGIAPRAPLHDVLRGISRRSLAPYVAWRFRQAFGAGIGDDGPAARALAGAYHVVANAALAGRGALSGLPAAPALTIDPSLKIYWLGRLLLERIANAGPAYADHAVLAADVEHYRRRFLTHFLSGPDARTVVEFGRDAAGVTP